jgi:hypothetical protein
MLRFLRTELAGEVKEHYLYKSCLQWIVVNIALAQLLVGVLPARTWRTLDIASSSERYENAIGGITFHCGLWILIHEFNDVNGAALIWAQLCSSFDYRCIVPCMFLLLKPNLASNPLHMAALWTRPNIVLLGSYAFLLILNAWLKGASLSWKLRW